MDKALVLKVIDSMLETVEAQKVSYRATIEAMNAQIRAAEGHKVSLEAIRAQFSD